MAGNVTVKWSHITITSIIAFLVGWFVFGLLGAVVIAVIVMALMGIIRFRR